MKRPSPNFLHSICLTIHGLSHLCGQQLMQQEPLARTLLHLAVCVGRLDLQEAAMELLAPRPEDSEVKGQGEDSGGAEIHRSKQPPAKGEWMFSCSL
jgi:hypothetical protein